MELTATDFRKHLFRTLERALEGESVEIVYKGAPLRLSTGEFKAGTRSSAASAAGPALLHCRIRFGTDGGTQQMEAKDILISPMVFLEFDDLFQRKRIAFGAREILAELNATFGVGLCRPGFAAVAEAALEITWTSDPFDRLIVAAAAARDQAPLVTRNRLVRQHYLKSLWQTSGYWGFFATLRLCAKSVSRAAHLVSRKDARKPWEIIEFPQRPVKKARAFFLRCW